jgi:hypothetical protein
MGFKLAIRLWVKLDFKLDFEWTATALTSTKTNRQGGNLLAILLWGVAQLAVSGWFFGHGLSKGHAGYGHFFGGVVEWLGCAKATKQVLSPVLPVLLRSALFSETFVLCFRENPATVRSFLPLCTSRVYAYATSTLFAPVGPEQAEGWPLGEFFLTKLLGSVSKVTLSGCSAAW